MSQKESIPCGPGFAIRIEQANDLISLDQNVFSLISLGQEAAGLGKHVLLVEMVLPGHDRDFVGNWLDLEILVEFDARERTAAAYAQLLGRAGFRMTRVVETVSPYSVVEAIAV